MQNKEGLLWREQGILYGRFLARFWIHVERDRLDADANAIQGGLNAILRQGFTGFKPGELLR